MADDGFFHYGHVDDSQAALHQGRKENCTVCDPDPVTLNGLAAQIHAIADEKGFWEGERNPGEVLMLIVSEAAEVLEAIRDGDALSEFRYEGRNTPCCRPVRVLSATRTDDCPKPVGVPSEMADIVIRVLDACAAWGIDIDRAVREKVEYNRTRPALHGRVR